MGNETFYWDSLNPIFFRVRNGDCFFNTGMKVKHFSFFIYIHCLYHYLKSLYTDENFLEIKGNFKI